MAHPESGLALETEANIARRSTDKLRSIYHTFETFSSYDQYRYIEEGAYNLLRPAVAERLLYMQFGSKVPWVTDEDTADLPPIAQERIRNAFAKRAQNLWYIPLYDMSNEMWVRLRDEGDKKDYPSHIQRFQKHYMNTARSLRIFPYPPRLKHVPNQRSVDHRARLLAVNTFFLNRLQNASTIEEAASSVLRYIYDSLKHYDLYDDETLQDVILRKANFTSDVLEELKLNGLWEDRSMLKMMCVDKGPRDHVIKMYGVYRDVAFSGYSGYSYGQTTEYLYGLFRDIHRAAA